MKSTWFMMLALGLPVSFAACAPAPAPAPQKTVITADAESVHKGIRCYTVVSAFQKGPNKLEVLLPDNLTTTRCYPVVYLLPVNPGTDGQWGSGIVEAQKSNLHNQYQMIFVAPAYEIWPWFGDNPEKPEVRQSSYILNVIVPFIEKEFPVKADKENRLLIGFSKSGLGALGLFLMHPELFGRIAIFDPAIGAISEKQYKEWGLIETYGPRENFDKYDPLELLRAQAPLLSKQPQRITLLGGGPGSRIGVDALHSRLRDFKVPYVYILGSDMAHTWTSGWLPLAVSSIAYPFPEAPKK